MAGLLDIFNTPEGALSLLAAAGARPGGRNTGEGLLTAFRNVSQAQQAEKDRAAQEQARALQARLIESQIGETMAQAAQRQAQVEQAKQEAQQQQQFLAALGGGMSPQQAMAGGGGPTQANAARMSQGPDFAALALRFPSQAKLLEQLAGAKNWGRDEVARTVAVAGPDNMPLTRRESKFGDAIGQDTRDPVKMQLENMGGFSQAVNPFALRDGQQFQRTNSPDSLLSAQTSMRGQNMADARAREGLALQRQGLEQKTAEGKPLTDAQSKALLFGARMKAADQVLGELAKSGTQTSIPGARAGYGIGPTLNFFSPAGQQQLNQAKRDFLSAVLRRESGAVISDSEFANGDQQYFPQPGDSKEVIQQKARNRQIATRGVLVEVPETHRGKVDDVIGGPAVNQSLGQFRVLGKE